MQNTNQSQDQAQPDYSKLSFEELVAHYALTKAINKNNIISAFELEIINQVFRKIAANYPQLPKAYIGDNLNVTLVVNSMLAAILCNLPEEFIMLICQGDKARYTTILALQGMGKLVNCYMQKQYGTTCPKVSVDNTGPGVDLTAPASNLDQN